MAPMSGRAAPGPPGHPRQEDSREGEGTILQDSREREGIILQDSRVEEDSRSEEVTAQVDNRAGEATAQQASREGKATARETLTWTPRLLREISSRETSTPVPTLSQEDGVRTGQELRSPG